MFAFPKHWRCFTYILRRIGAQANSLWVLCRCPVSKSGRLVRSSTLLDLDLIGSFRYVVVGVEKKFPSLCWAMKTRPLHHVSLGESIKNLLCVKVFLCYKTSSPLDSSYLIIKEIQKIMVVARKKCGELVCKSRETQGSIRNSSPRP